MDALVRTRKALIDLEVATEDELRALETAVEDEVREAATEALTRPQPEPETVTRHLFSETSDSTGPAFDTEDTPQYREGRDLTMVDLLNSCLEDEMKRDPRVVVFGQDVADMSRESGWRRQRRV